MALNLYGCIFVILFFKLRKLDEAKLEVSVDDTTEIKKSVLFTCSD